MFAPINLEANVHLIDADSETVPTPTQAVTLVIRQGIEILVKDCNGYPDAVVFIELSQGQVRALVWDIFSDPIADAPVTYLLKDANPKETKA